MNRRPNMAHDKTPSAQLPVWERIRSFDEVDLGYTAEEAVREAERCLNCPDRWCAQHCPAHNYIPEFIAKVREGDFQAAWELLALTNPLMEISGRVCPFEQQCESHCTRGIKCEPVAIGKLERFVADWHRKQQTGKPDKNVFSITPAGRDELLRWLRDDNLPGGFRNPFLMKTFFDRQIFKDPAVFLFNI